MKYSRNTAVSIRLDKIILHYCTDYHRPDSHVFGFNLFPFLELWLSSHFGLLWFIRLIVFATFSLTHSSLTD